MEIYIEFSKWLDKLLGENKMPENTAAFCFNLYEEEDENYGIQLIASDEFDENDGGDWACSEIWSSEEDIFYIDHSDEKDADAERGLEFISGLIRSYLENGKYRSILLGAKAVAAGFIDGDISILNK
ncbi:MAG: hypothetical protein IJX77_07160 [Ruminococcus sp.]|nr:hypothetical protein [Ruminococcus sp.]